MQDFAKLASVPVDSFVDVVGKVTKVGKYVEKTRARRSDQTSFQLVEKEIVVCNGNFFEHVELTGRHAKLSLQVGDTVAFKGVKLTEWGMERKLQPAF